MLSNAEKGLDRALTISDRVGVIKSWNDGIDNRPENKITNYAHSVLKFILHWVSGIFDNNVKYKYY